MQINRIEFQAVGPFPGRHVIDVDALGGNGLFLLDGPTGAGKTTLIDVLVFALYGHTAGAESSLKRLRSDHADPGTETYVDVVVTLAAGTYRVRRTPEYERPRKRGTGTTTQPHTAKVWRLSAADVDALAAGEDPPGGVVATQVGEASAEVQRLVGLNRAQFTQTVVLPQGQFAAFLHARPDERRGILQQIFGTDLYERIHDHGDSRRPVDDGLMAYVPEIEEKLKLATGDNAHHLPQMLADVQEKYQRRLERAHRIE